MLRQLGSRVDANSVGEIQVALRPGFAPREIVFTGVGKTRDELALAIALGVNAINVESAGELDRIAAIAGDQGQVPALRCGSTPISTPRAIRISRPD